MLRAGGGAARLPMNMDTVNSVAVAGVRGSTASDQSITLYRGAFENGEQLAKTLVHEQWHVGQLQDGLPYPETFESSAAEIEAESVANAWWDSIVGGWGA